MKKVLGVMLVLTLIAGMLVSCNQEVQSVADTEFGKELVSVSFTTEGSKALTATREAFDEANYVWKYEATKDDASGLTHGQTEEAQYVVNGTTAGLKGNTVTNLSQGYWNFTLYAYKAIKNSNNEVTGHSETYSFKGSVTHQKVVKGALTSISVTVVPNTAGKGSIKFSTELVLKTLAGVAYSGTYTDESQLRMRFEVKKQGESAAIDSSKWTELAAGTYIVTVEVYDKDDVALVYATESKVVTVYTGLETVISGNVGELSSGIQFGDVTADIIEATASVSSDDAETTGSVVFQQAASTSATEEKVTKVEASLPKATAKDMLGTIDEGTSKDLTLTLSVQAKEAEVVQPSEPEEPTTKSKEYDISLIGTTVVTNNTTGAVDSSVEVIKNISNSEETLEKYYLTATLTIDKGLDGVTVTHSGEQMIAFTGENPAYTDDEYVTAKEIWKGFYKYDKVSGVLTIKTRSFSPFVVSYTEPVDETVAEDDYVAMVIDKDGYIIEKYLSVDKAVINCPEEGTVKLLKNHELPAKLVVNPEQRKIFVFDLNNKTLTGRINLCNVDITIKNGTINSGSMSQAVNVYGTTDVAYAGGEYTVVTIKDDVVINGEYGICFLSLIDNGYYPLCYGVKVDFYGTSECKSPAYVSGNIGFDDYKYNIGSVDLSKWLPSGITAPSKAMHEFGPVFNVYGKLKTVGQASDGGQGISLSGMVIVNVYDGAELVGAEGVGMKSGVLNVYGGSIESNGPKKDPVEAVNSGTEASGAAISVSTYYTSKEFADRAPITVNISGGEIKGKNNGALLITHSYDKDKNQPVPAKQPVSISVTGGTLTSGSSDIPSVFVDSKITGDDAGYPTRFISGGYFSSNPSDYLLEGYGTVFNEESQLWTVVNLAETYGNLFAGGKGTEEEPFYIIDYDTFQNVSELFEVGTAFYKVRDDIHVIDCNQDNRTWKCVNMNGSFDGNGVKIINLDESLFGEVCTNAGETVVIKNFEVDANIIDEYGDTIVYWTDNDIEFDSIAIHGFVQGSSNSALYMGYGPSDKTPWKCTFKNCYSDATYVSTIKTGGVYVGHPYALRTDYSIKIIDSEYTGQMYTTEGGSNCHAYTNYYGSTYNVHVSNDNGTTFTEYKGEEPLPESQRNKSGIVGTIPAKYDVFVADAAENCVSATAFMTIGPNDTNEKGNYTGVYINEENLSIVDGKIYTSEIKYFDVTINGISTSSTGVSSDGKIFNIVNPLYGTTYGSYFVSLNQYDNENKLISTTTFNPLH